jgi:CubicO group peptidase (beta-lactamase class C family)
MKKLTLIIILLFFCISISVSFGQSSNIDNSLNSYVKDHSFSGTILIQKDDQVQYHKSFGFSNRQFSTPNTNETKYKIASITKLFTSVLIMQLYEQGKIDLDSSVKTYLPGYASNGASKITIRNLLNHTSGLPYVGPKSKEDALKIGMEEFQMPHSIDELISKYYSRDLANEPGKTFNYNNGEYIILGKIIENVYGKSFKEILNQQIISPLAMKGSGLLFQYQIVDNLSYSYFTMNDTSGLVNDMPVYIQNWYSAGAMYSTNSDLSKFSNALFSYKLLKKETLNLMLQPGLEDYGFGIWVYDIVIKEKKYKVYKRPGDIMGTQAMFIYMPDKKLSIIILANTDSANLDDFSDEIMKQLIE